MGIETALIAGAGLLSAGSSIAEGAAAGDAADQNSAMARLKAKQATEQAQVQETQYRSQSAKEMGSNRAAVGASGVDFGGSATDVLAENARNSEMNALNIRHQGAVQAAGLNQEADQYAAQASSSRTMGYLRAGGSLIGGATSLARMK